MVRSAIEGGLTKAAAALPFNVTAKTVAKWVRRFREEGVDGLRDPSSRPLHCYLGKQIAPELGISPATGCPCGRQCGLWPLFGERYSRE